MPTGPVLRGGLESLERINNFIKPLRAVGGIGGGIGGYLTGEEDEPGERILHTMGGAALGGGVIPGMIRTAKMAKDMFYENWDCRYRGDGERVCGASRRCRE